MNETNKMNNPNDMVSSPQTPTSTQSFKEQRILHAQGYASIHH